MTNLFNSLDSETIIATVGVITLIGVILFKTIQSIAKKIYSLK
jgi:ABC-type nitrate/sulfonate/bicarbonate transport system permease component